MPLLFTTGWLGGLGQKRYSTVTLLLSHSPKEPSLTFDHSRFAAWTAHETQECFYRPYEDPTTSRKIVPTLSEADVVQTEGRISSLKVQIANETNADVIAAWESEIAALAALLPTAVVPRPCTTCTEATICPTCGGPIGPGRYCTTGVNLDNGDHIPN